MSAQQERPALVTDFTGATHRPLTLTQTQRAAMATRLMVVAPPGIPPRELVSQRRRIEGLPHDILLALEALALLAAQGNELAATMLTQERIRLGIDRPKYSFGR